MSDVRDDNISSVDVNTADTVAKEPVETLVKGKRRAGAEETRERILDAAQHLFAVHGFDATATKTIAQRAEVPNSLVFYYFPTKKALLENLINERNMFPKLQAVMDVPHGADIRTILIHIGVRYLEASHQNPEVPRILLREFRCHREVAEHFKAFREEVILLIASYLTEAMRVRELKQGNVQAVARIFVYNLIVTASIEDRPEESLQFIEDMVDALLCGLMP
jgi:AcrR family transcriptional regulator